MKIGLGTVQFGMDYGVSNAAGKVLAPEVSKILDLAKQQSISILDTASSYGNSEEVLGSVLADDRSFSIVTKTPVFKNEIITKSEVTELNNAFAASLKKLQQPSVYGLLVHSSEDLLKHGGDLLWEKMCNLKEQGLVKKIGVSVYTAEQIDRISDKYSIDLIQVSINVFDQRLLLSGHLSKLKKTNIEIHARSIFLQGVLLSKVTDLPSYFKPFHSHLQRYYEFVYKHNWSPVQASLGFALGIEEIDTVLLGVESEAQLREIINTAKSLDSSLFRRFAMDDDLLLNPSKWQL